MIERERERVEIESDVIDDDDDDEHPNIKCLSYHYSIQSYT